MSDIYHLRGLRFSYGSIPLLRITKQGFGRHSLCALVGNNGAGKSTLLQLLAFLKSPDAGMLRFAGQEVHGGNQTLYRAQVGLIPQNPYLLRGSVCHNIELGLRFRRVPREEREQRSKKTMTLLNIDGMATRPVQELSGGESQRVALGRMLVLEPRVLLLDEPFTWLDAESIEEFSILMRYLCHERGTTMIYTTHDQVHAHTLADCVYVLRSGELERLK